jgi:hypothetical protein
VSGSAFNSNEALERYAELAKNLAAEGKVWDKAGDVAAPTGAGGTVRNLVCEAMMMRTDGASYGDRERFTGPTFGRS